MVVTLERSLRDALDEARALCPTGEAWTDDDRSTWVALLAGLSTWRGKVDHRAGQLLVESDPRTAVELLPDWEAEVGLPDECLSEPDSVAERRALVVSRLVGPGGGSRRFFSALAAALGYEVTIDEGASEPFRAGVGRAGESLGGELGWYVWTVNAPQTLVRYARAGQARAGEALRTWGNALLECVLRRSAPAHTLVLFRYAGECVLTVFDEGGSSVFVELVGDTLVVLDEHGDQITIPLTEGTLVVYDENGDPVTIEIDCPED